MIEIKANPMETIPLGRLGENRHTRVTFDLAEYDAQYPQAGYTLLYRRPGDAAAYPPAGVEVKDGRLRWTVTDAELSAAGAGQCELLVRSGGAVAKSCIFDTRVLPALDDSGAAPEPWESWAERFAGVKDAAEGAARAAEGAADAAEARAQRVEQLAERLPDADAVMPRGEIEARYPFGYFGVTEGETLIDNLELSFTRDEYADIWHSEPIVGPLNAKNFSQNQFYFMTVDGETRLVYGETFSSSWVNYNGGYDGPAVGDLGVIGTLDRPKDAPDTRNGANGPQPWIGFAHETNRRPEFSFPGYCLAFGFGRYDINAKDLGRKYRLHTTNDAPTHTLTLKRAQVNAVRPGSLISGIAPEALMGYYTQDQLAGGVEAEGQSVVVCGAKPRQKGKDWGSFAVGTGSCAPGNGAIAMGLYAQAYANESVAIGEYCHAMGQQSIAMGFNALSEGQRSVAIGSNTVANGRAQVAIGQYNYKDEAKTTGHGGVTYTYIFIVGNGGPDPANPSGPWIRSNAHTIDWQGNGEFQGDVVADGCGGENPVSLRALAAEVAALRARLSSLEEAMPE